MALDEILTNVKNLSQNSQNNYQILSKPIVDAIHALSVSSPVDIASVVTALISLNNNLITAINSQNPVYQYKTATKFTIANLAAATSAVILPANPLRRGMTIYNNSTNSLYLCIEDPAVAANLIGFCATNAGPTSLVTFAGPGIYTGKITGIRNAGSGGITAWEFT